MGVQCSNGLGTTFQSSSGGLHEWGACFFLGEGYCDSHCIKSGKKKRKWALSGGTHPVSAVLANDDGDAGAEARPAWLDTWWEPNALCSHEGELLSCLFNLRLWSLENKYGLAVPFLVRP